MMIKNKEFVGKNHKDLEKACGFDYYLETKDDFLSGEEVDRKELMNSFIEFNKNKELQVVKLYDGIIQEFNEMELDDIKSNLMDLSESKGIFYDDSDDELATCYGFLCENYFAEIMENIIFFSGKEDSVYAFVEILDKHNVKYHEPYNPSESKEKLVKLRKLGRNEKCHCGSEIKKVCVN